MGTLVGLLRLGLASALLTPLLASSCKREEPCQPSARILELPAPYNQFFNQLRTCDYTSAHPPVSVSSSNGLTDSFSNNCVSSSVDYSAGSSTGCETLGFGQRSVYTYAALYGFRFVTLLEQYPNGPRLLVRDWSTSSAAASLELGFYFATGFTYASYRDAASNTTVPFGQAPTVTELANFQSGGRTYAQVWRITNPLNQAQGRPSAATVLFVDRDYGLIRFEQRDGTVWTLAY